MNCPYKQSYPAYVFWQPRPNQDDRFDQQESFYESDATGVNWLIGGNGAGTTEVACAKVAKFLYETEAPRVDTPFWVIANTYEQVMKAVWVEKLYGHGHILHETVDWSRVLWYSSKQGWPYRVPLLPHPYSSTNWVIEFKSIEQGRAKMQAESIGGFMFSEQFPYSILEEVLRGCRVYNYPGSKICEFTPIDPVLSQEIEEMIDEDRMPDNWRVFRANTECAKEAGHVTDTWFNEFFGMVPEEMLETRMTGRFATYEGAVFTQFNPNVHLVDDDVIDFPKDITHYRSIDWGSGPENAFVCLWMYKNGLGQWYVYDEYYSTDQNYTTIDHLCEVQDRWPWPLENPHYRHTFADPSSPGNIRIASKLASYKTNREGIGITPASNAVIEGIEHVQWCLKKDRALSVPDIPEFQTGQPRLYIHKYNCPKLSRQIRTYRWERSNLMGINPRDARRIPLKKDDHTVDALRYAVYSEASRSNGTIESRRKKHGDRQVKSRQGILLDATGHPS